MAKKQNQIFQGFGSGSGVAAGTTPAKITTQVKVATAAPTPKASNPFTATANSASSNPFVSTSSGPVGGAVGTASSGGGCNGRCKNSERCVNGQCVPKNDGTGNVCQNDNQCGSNKRCVGGYCVDKGGGGGGVGGPCAGVTCPAGTTCQPHSLGGHACVPNGGGGTTDPCAGVTCPPGSSCMPSPSGGHRCAPDRVPPPGGGDPPTNVCSAANPQGECPPGQLCDNGACRNLAPGTQMTPGQIDLVPEEYYRYVVGRGGLHTNQSNALGAFITDQYDDIHKGWQTARIQNPALNWTDYIARTFGPEQMVADYLRRKFLGSSAAQQGFNPSEYGSGPARWSVF